MKKSVINIGKSIIDAYIDITPTKGGDVINYGDNNAFPNELLQTVEASPTAMSCIEKKVSFISANGLIDDKLANIKNAGGFTLNDVIVEAAYSLAIFDGVYYRITYSIEGTPLLEVLPYETVRKAKAGGFLVNKNWGKKGFSKKDTIFIPEFSHKKTTQEKVKEALELKENYVGEIFYSFKKRPGKYIYSVPTYYSGIEDIRSDAAVISLENSNIEQGFNVDFILYTFGKMDDNIKGEDGLTDLERFRRDLKEFRQPGQKKIMHIESETKDNMPVITPVPLRDVIDAIEKARDRIPRAVCRHMGVPPVLIGLPNPEGFGNTQALANYMKLFNHSIKKDKQRIESDLKFIYGFDFKISELNLIDYIEPQLLEVLTVDEKRKMIGYDN